MTLPAYSSKGTVGSGSLDVCTTLCEANVTLPATINSGDILVVATRATCFGGTIDIMGIDTAYGTTTKIYENGLGSGTVHMSVWTIVANGTGDSIPLSVQAVMSGSSGSMIAQCARFVNSGDGLIDTSSGGAVAADSTTPSFAAVTTSVANELAIGIVTKTGTQAIGSMTGESGGDWVEAVAEDTALGLMIQFQTAAMVAAGTITGGSFTLGGSEAWRSFSFALKEVPPPAKAKMPLRPSLRFMPKRRARAF